MLAENSFARDQIAKATVNTLFEKRRSSTEEKWVYKRDANAGARDVRKRRFRPIFNISAVPSALPEETCGIAAAGGRG